MFGSPTPADYVGESIPKEPEQSLKNDETYGRLGLPANVRFPVKKLFAAARSSQISPKFRVWCCRILWDSISSISCEFSGNRSCLLTRERGYYSVQDCVHGAVVLCAMPPKVFYGMHADPRHLVQVPISRVVSMGRCNTCSKSSSRGLGG